MKKAAAVLLCIALLFGLCSCAVNNGADVPHTGKYVIDGAGRQIEIPENNSELSIASVYAVAVPFIKALGITDRVKAINSKSVFWTQNDESLSAAGSVGRGTVDLEALASYSPVVLIHRSNDSETVEAVSRLGIDVLCISAENPDGVYDTLALLGEYFGVQARAAEITSWMKNKFGYIDSVVAGIPKEERVTALCMGGEPGRIAGGDMLQSWMIEKAGGICVSKDIANNSNWQNVGIETVFEWNPDFVFCTSSTALSYSPESLKADSSWSGVSAIINDSVYKIPAGIDSWDLPGVSCVIGTMYMLYRMYPEYITADELKKQIDEYYTLIFGKTFDADYLGYELG